jgi:uncharacterized protein (DUF697 family)/tellurite resistance protein
MTESEQQAIITVALLATMADGRAVPAEKTALEAALGRVGGANLDAVARKVSAGQIGVTDVAGDLVSDESRRLAYQTAVAICHADGPPNPSETAFLGELRNALGLPEEPAPVPEVGTLPPRASPAALDELILKQAMIAAALELLPDQLANIAIIPVQLRMVYQIGQHHGQQLDASQVKDLAATLGLGVTAQVLEDVVRKTLGGLAKGIFGGLVGGATGLAAGAAVTFASTYALGHVAKQYYAQGRKLSAEDLRALFARFQEDAKTIFPKVQEQIQTQAQSLNLQSLLGGMR